ncbi:hypothetical protein BGZ54_001204 [Gamsiella multidivaricata]|nr:hypothetical protein BGZ54_001204 [Gamsiella multidivaricata]
MQLPVEGHSYQYIQQPTHQHLQQRSPKQTPCVQQQLQQYHNQTPRTIEYINPVVAQVHPTLIRDSSEPSLVYASVQNDGSNSASLSTAAEPPVIAGASTGSCDSSILGSIFKQKYRRRASSVFGWDSDDDYELDIAAAKAAAPESVNHPLNNEKSPWLRNENRKRKKVQKCVCLGVILVFVAFVIVLLFCFKEEIFRTLPKGERPRKGFDGPPRPIEEVYAVNKTITPDPRLGKVFYGIDYTPGGAQEPDCSVNLGNVIEDMKLLSQLTSRVRMYGLGCHQTEAVLKAMDYLGLLDMQIIVTLWVDSNRTYWEQQQNIFWSLIDNDLTKDTGYVGASDLNQQDPKAAASAKISKVVSRIIGISVGNEVLFRNEDKNNVNEQVPASVLEGYINSIRQGLASRANAATPSPNSDVVALGQHLARIPVFSSDLGRNADQIVNSVDWVMSNIHPFFAYTAVNQAATWAFTNFKNETVKVAAGKSAVISEIGWPSGPSTANLGPAVPSIQNLQTFLDTWVCQANKRNIPYFYFEAFDEPWKRVQNPREAQWGIMTPDRQLKVTIPTC